MGHTYSLLSPPKAKFTEKELSDQTGKVFIVTGGTSGVGKALVQILYSHNAKVYLTGRSEQKATDAIKSIKSSVPDATGELVYLHLDLDDLTTIKKSAEEFLSKEKKLDVLWNNAGVMVPPDGSKTKQGYEMQLGTNNVAPFLFTKLLTPLLVETAKTASPGSVRVVWVASSAAEATSPKGGVDMNNLDYKQNKQGWTKYGVSKAGNVLHGKEYAKLHKDDGIVSVSLNPGNLKTDLQRHMSGLMSYVLDFILFPPIQGAYTELFAGLSPDVKMEQTGAWIQPWGRLGVPLRKDLVAASKTEAEGGTGIAAKFWEWSEEQVKPYL